MSRLDEFLSIPSRRERHIALARYAASLGAEPAACRDESGAYNEEKLVILIFDSEQRRKRSQRNNFNFLGIGLAVLVIMIALIGLLPRIMVSIYKQEEDAENGPGKVYHGYTKDGNPASEGGEPVLFKAMEGTYEKYDPEGHLTEEHYYEGGELRRIKKFNLQGRVISDVTLPGGKK